MNHHKPGSLTQLIARLSDGTITPDEITQLNQQLLADPIAMEAYLDHMELDAMLEREFGGQASVKMPHGIPMAGCLGLSPSRGKASWQLLTRVALTAVVLLVVGYVVHSFLSRGPERPHLVQDAPSEVADNSRRPMAFGRVLDDGEALTIEAGTEVLHFQDGTKITLTGPATLVVHHPAIGKRLQLRQGMLQAEVTPQPADQPLVIDTPNAAVRVLGTRFELSADEQSGTCLNLESGRVELLREGQASVFVAPNSIAMVPTTDEPIMIMPRPRMLVAPKRETRCSGQGLWSLEFAEVGRTVVAIAKNVGGARTQTAFVADGRLFLQPEGRHGSQSFWMLDAEPKEFKVLGVGSKVADPLSVGKWLPPHSWTTAYANQPIVYPLVDGRLFVRGLDAIYCYDLRVPAAK